VVAARVNVIYGSQLGRLCYGKTQRARSKNEKTFDNRCAALVSREPRAPRAGDERKSFAFKTLESTSRPERARGAHVSRAARVLERPV